jgi:hypothetical protein
MDKQWANKKELLKENSSVLVMVHRMEKQKVQLMRRLEQRLVEPSV